MIAVRRTGLTEEQKIGLALADNRTSDLSEWDQEMLNRLGEQHDISLFFSQDDLDGIIETEAEQLPPEDFAEVDDDITTEHRCPSCGYEWSGKSS